MQKSQTQINLQKWKNDPINAGSIYIKPINETETNYCGYLYYFCFCGCFF